MRAAVLWLILGTALLRVVLAAGTGLGIDESYMVAAGRTLQLSYFDHPGLAWWLSRLAALAAGSEAPGVVRLPFIALFAWSTWLLFALTRRAFGARAGWWAAVGFNLSPVFSVTTASWVLPDGPLVCALLAAVHCLGRVLDEADTGKGGLSPLAGLAAGLALLSKYSAVLVLLGAAIHVATQPVHRAWLRRPQPYAAAAIAGACCAPILLWNACHHWASFAFQGGRAESVSLHPFGPLLTLAGEAAFVGPWVWLPMMLAWIAALRAGPAAWRGWLFACLAAPALLLFVVISFWARHVLFHWAVPGYLMLFPLLGDWAARIEATRPRLLRRGTKAAAALLVGGCALLLVEARVNLLAPFGADPGLQAADWTPLRAQLAERGLLHRPDIAIAATSWADAGKLDYGLGGSVPVFCLNPDARQYLFLPPPPPGGDTLLIGPRLSLQRLAQSYPGVAFQALPPLQLRDTPIPLFLAAGWRR